MRIDCQTHIFPSPYAEILTKNQGLVRTVPRSGGYLLEYGAIQKFVMDQETYSLAKKLRDMDDAQVDVSLLSVNMPGPESLDCDLALAGARACNDALAEAVRLHPDRFGGFAALPWQLGAAAVQELERAVNDLGLIGVMFYSHLDDAFIDDARFDPLWERMVVLDVPLVLHPTVAPWCEYVKEYSMVPMAGLMAQQSFAMLRLLLGGVMERHPQLKVVQPHCGGILPYLWGRIEHQTEVMGRSRERITRPVADYYQNVYLDVVSPSLLAMQFAVEFAGVDRLLFASDHPWVEIGVIAQLVDQLDVSDADKQKIFSGNAQALFRLK